MLKSEKIPITVGVVGHLDVITTEDHKIQIEKLFTDLAIRYPSSPVYLFSSIAEGADRYVANIFLDLKEHNDDFRERFELIVPMPFEKEEYKKDFDDLSDKEFEKLLMRAKRSYSIGYEGKEINRPEQYLRTGKLVADSSLILIALWDGREGKTGGTADIVKHKITGDDDTVAESTFEYDGTVFVIPSSRTKSSLQISAKPESRAALSLELVLKDNSLKEALEKIEEINRNAESVSDEELEKSKSYLFKIPEKLEYHGKWLMNWHSMLDVLSLRFRKKDIHVTVWLFSLGLAIILSLELYSNIWTTRLAFGITMVILITAVLVYLNSRIKRFHIKYLYNRTLAEALRIQFYWNYAGLQRNVSDYILRIHRKEFSWVKYILSAVYGITYNTGAITQEKIKDLTKNWVRSQADFFEAAIRRMTERISRYHLVSNVSFILAFILFTSIFFFEELYKSNDCLNLLLIISAVLLGIFALVKAYIQQKGYEQLLNQYELMQVIYQRAEAKINEINSLDENTEYKNSYLKELFFVVGKEALIENGNWYLIFKEKEPELEGI
mgnify:CR=1 FL=1